MGKRTRECYLCGKKYSYCPTCSEDRTKPSWMIEFHEENCVKIFATCTEFNIGQLTKDEAKKALSNCDLSNKDAFAPYVQNDLSVIFAEDTITVDVEAEIKEITKDEVTVEVKPVTKNKSKSKSKAHEVVNKEENK